MLGSLENFGAALRLQHPLSISQLGTNRAFCPQNTQTPTSFGFGVLGFEVYGVGVLVFTGLRFKG